MSGTDLSHAGISLRTCYAMSGTDLAHAVRYWPSACRYVPTRLLCRVRYCPRSCYAVSGTVFQRQLTDSVGVMFQTTTRGWRRQSCTGRCAGWRSRSSPPTM
eukprot:1925852-Rhodomonas_salina.3